MRGKSSKAGTREWLARLLLAGFGLAIGVVTAEIAVRIAAPQSVVLWRPGPFVADDEGYFRFRPGHRGKMTNRTEYEVEFEVNSLGMRGAEPGPPDAETCRMLAIGDSYTFGLGIDEAEVFHQVATAELRGAGSPIETLNGGMPAIGVPQAVRWIERHGLAAEPDLVLLAIFIGNDLRDANLDYDNWAVANGQLTSPTGYSPLKDWLFNNIHLYVLLKTALPAGVQKTVRAALGMGEPWGVRYARESFLMYDPAVPPLVQEGLERTDEAVGRLLQLAGEHRFGVAAVLIPDLVQVDDQRWAASLEQLDLAGGHQDPRQPNQLLGSVLERRGVPVLDLLDHFDTAFDRGDPVYFPLDHHWTAEGHATAGRELAGFLAPIVDSCGAGEGPSPAAILSADGKATDG
jgi:lysophospholipase L1-like esterase